MSTYLHLCQRLRREVGESGNDSTVVSAAGEWRRICEWIAVSWDEIQKRHPIWEWMRTAKNFNTIASQGEYAYAQAPISLTNFASWRNNSFRIYKDSTDDEQFLDHWSYNDFRDEYLLGSNRTTYSRPIVIAISPSKSLLLGSPPDDVYTVEAEYYKAPTTLSADTDEPGMPERFHDAIVYRAMIHYGMYEAAQEVVARGERFYREYLEELEFDQLPPVGVNRSFI